MERIKRLEKAVINRIAAGEVIQRPANAIKEMIENSLDAGATAIQVTVKAGGLKMLQVQDNGHGIEKGDLKIVCERFTTSKLETFEDLSNLSTYGFRGEALASISHVAHVTITTRTPSSKCAFKAAYSDGVLVPLKPGASAEPKVCAGNQGTVITVEDLFYNVATRKKALRSPSDELVKITSIVMKYAIHNSGIAFTLKKQGATVAEVKTTATNCVQDNIGLLYGAAVQKELVSVEVENRTVGFRMRGFVTNANYSLKKFQFLLFINSRLVDSQSLRKALELVYANFLPKNSHPFVYLSIFISHENIDVNVHPTKHEVHFLHEDVIVECIQKTIQQQLLSCNSSRTYYTQSLLPSSTAHAPSQERGASRSTEEEKVYDYKLVRTDAKEKKLDLFAVPKSLSPQSNCDAASNRKPRKAVHLTSILSLQNDIKKNIHNDLQELFCNYTFVGFVNQTKALLQYETGLFLVDMSTLSKELFFQLVIFDFSNFGALKLTPQAPVYEMVLLAIESPSSGWSPEDGPKEKMAQYVVDFLSTKAEMLLEYFSLEIKDGLLCSLPVLLDCYTPNFDRLPHFLLCLAVEVDWSSEKDCFLTFAQECASFYSIQHDPFLKRNAGGQLYKDSSWQWVAEHIVLPAIGSKLSPPCSLAQNGTVLQIADLHELYKVFERC